MSKVDYKKLEAHISRDPETFLRAMGFDGKIVGDEFVVGDITGKPGKTFRINLRTSAFNDLNPSAKTSKGRGWIMLVSRKLGVTKYKAAKNICEMMTWKLSDFQISSDDNSNLSVVMPVPESAQATLMENGEKFNTKKGYELAEQYDYRSLNGDLLHKVLRFEKPGAEGEKPKKAIRPFYYYGESDGWMMKAPAKQASTSLYRLEMLAEDEKKPVLVVEGEKTANSAQVVFPDHVAITWQGGASRISKADWSPLEGREVIYWPDNDDAGRASVDVLQAALGLVRAKSYSVVTCSGQFPNKWDLADPRPDGVDVLVLLETAEAMDLSEMVQMQKLPYEALPDAWYYIVESDEFYYKPNGFSILKRQFDSLYRHLPDRRNSTVGNRFLEDFDDNKLIKRLYSPGDPKGIVAKDGMRCLNTWRPGDIEAQEGDASIFVEHLRYIVGNDDDLEHLLNMLAFIVQNPGKKIKHMCILVGREGTGKSYVGDVMRRLVGFHNSVMIETDDLKSGFNAYMEDNLLVVVEELMAFSRKDINNSLKPKITQLTISINKKHQQPREVQNTVNFIAFTNHIDALQIGLSARRYFVAGTDSEKKERSYYVQLWNWTNENFGVILHFLLERDLSKFSPDAHPPVTDMKREMAEASRPPVEAEIARMIEQHEEPFDQDLVELKVVERHLRNRGERTNRSEITKAFRSLGVVDLKQHKGRVNGVEERASLWCVRKPDYWKKVAPSERLLAYFQPVPEPNIWDIQESWKV